MNTLRVLEPESCAMRRVTALRAVIGWNSGMAKFLRLNWGPRVTRRKARRRRKKAGEGPSNSVTKLFAGSLVC